MENDALLLLHLLFCTHCSIEKQQELARGRLQRRLAARKKAQREAAQREDEVEKVEELARRANNVKLRMY